MKKTVTRYGGDAIIEFDSDKHGYEQIGTIFSRLPVPGFTSIADQIIPKYGLPPWYARLTSEYVYSNWREGMGKEDIAKLCAAAREAPNKARDTAGLAGTIVHKFVEEILKTGKGTLPTDPLAAAACAAFLDWFHTNNIVCLESERIGFSKHHWYCCTTDFYGHVNNEICVADFKTGAGVFYDEREVLQLAASAIAIEEDLEIVTINVGWILHLNKNTGKFTPYRVELTQYVKDKWRRAIDWYRARNYLKPIVNEIKGGNNAKRNNKRPVRKSA